MTEYGTLKVALKAMRENFMDGDLSGFASHAELVATIRAMERRMFEIIRDA
ncbi:MAG: hypothetical protein V5B35_03865 [Candidatus Accumulibacter necessarius]|jgi:hypothetical protein|uniref:hypothetical protein n=1 Tax=Candidatus Accumulibacter necessarius TaxID=2954386 RepID=UPI002FC2C98C